MSCAQIMKKCWSHVPDARPSFRVLKEELASVTQTMADWLCVFCSASANQSWALDTILDALCNYEQTTLSRRRRHASHVSTTSHVSHASVWPVAALMPWCDVLVKLCALAKSVRRLSVGECNLRFWLISCQLQRLPSMDVAWVYSCMPETIDIVRQWQHTFH